MYISGITEIDNFRNLTGKSISFNKDINFLIGENNIGKTNVLELINTIIVSNRFEEEDFHDINKPIKIKFNVEFLNDEMNFLKRNFKDIDSNSVEISVYQSSVDSKLDYYFNNVKDRNSNISIINKLNAIYYISEKLANKGSDGKRTHSWIRVLYYFFQPEQLLSEREENEYIKKNKLEKIIIPIIEKIYEYKKSMDEDDYDDLLIDVNGKKYFPLFMILDEPEVHHHPYGQRGLVRKIEAIMNNENQIVLNLLKSLFKIDGLKGQIFIATHSSNILLNNYKQFIRIYNPIDNENSNLEIVSGEDIELNNRLYKHMLHNFIYLKEAMFSKCIVFVEGDTESGAMPVFSRRLGLDIDDRGIGFVKLDGADSVKYCMKLYSEFGIRVLAIIDRDKINHYSKEPDIFFTEGKDFEEDIYDNFNLVDYLECTRELDSPSSFISILQREGFNFDPQDFLKNPKIITIPESIQKKIMKEQKEKQLIVLRGSKNGLKGYILAKFVTVVPPAFKKVLMKLSGEIK